MVIYVAKRLTPPIAKIIYSDDPDYIWYAVCSIIDKSIYNISEIPISAGFIRRYVTLVEWKDSYAEAIANIMGF